MDHRSTGSYTSRVARGAASEMLATAWLMEQGFHVFRAVAASCPVDLVAWREGDTSSWLIEVKTMSVNCSFPWPRNEHWTHLIVVNPETNSCHLLEAGISQAEAVDSLRVEYGLEPVVRRGSRGAAFEVLKVIRTDPGREWTPKDVAGLLGKEQSVVVSNMGRLTDMGELERIKHGVYVLR